MAVLGKVSPYFLLLAWELCHGSANLLGALCTPRTDPSETHWRNSSDVTGDVPHRGRRILGSRPKVYWGQALQEVNCATVGHARVTIDHDVFTHPHCVCLI